jgi:hypothetical protein
MPSAPSPLLISLRDPDSDAAKRPLGTVSYMGSGGTGAVFFEPAPRLWWPMFQMVRASAVATPPATCGHDRSWSPIFPMEGNASYFLMVPCSDYTGSAGSVANTRDPNRAHMELITGAHFLLRN